MGGGACRVMEAPASPLMAAASWRSVKVLSITCEDKATDVAVQGAVHHLARGQGAGVIVAVVQGVCQGADFIEY